MDQETQESNIVRNAAQSVKHVLDAFEVFRKDNLLMRDFIDDMMAVLEKNKCPKNQSISCVEGIDVEDAHKETVTSSSSLSSPVSELPYVVASKKRKLDVSNSGGGSSTDANATISTERETDGVGIDVHKDVDSKKENAEVQVFDLVLDAILNHLPAFSLMTCRAVNHKWNSVATKILLRKQMLKVNVGILNEREHHQQPRLDSRGHKVYLTDLSNLITNPVITKSDIESTQSALNSQLALPWEFPSSHFTFLSNNVSTRILNLFIKDCGHIIKHFEIQLYDGRNQYCSTSDGSARFRHLSDFKKILTNFLPNVETLTLRNFPPLWYDKDDLSRLFPEPSANQSLYLSKLTTVTFFTPPPPSILMDLVTSAPSINILNMRGKCDPGLLKLLGQVSKIHLLKQFDLILELANLNGFIDVMQDYENKLNLTKLSIAWQDPTTHAYARIANFVNRYNSDVAYVISKFLSSICQSLVELETDRLGSLLDSHRSLQIPVLPKMKSLRITSVKNLRPGGTYRLSKGNMFPSGTRLSDKFPVLETFICSACYGFEALAWDAEIGAEINDSLPSVKHLHLVDVQASLLPKFCHLFPNLRTASVEIVGDFKVAARALWKLEKLETLSIRLEVSGEPFHTFPNIDKAFTGFSAHTCAELFDTPTAVDSSGFVVSRKYASILDLKNLRSLNLWISDSVERAIPAQQLNQAFRLISHVTGVFAFRMCPQLHVSVSCTSLVSVQNLEWLKLMISPILPYVCYSEVRMSC